MRSPSVLALLLVLVSFGPLRAADSSALTWSLPAGSSRDGDIVTVKLEKSGTSMPCAKLDLSPYAGKTLKATIKCRGENVAPGPQYWLGFKFMISYADEHEAKTPDRFSPSSDNPRKRALLDGFSKWNLSR